MPELLKILVLGNSDLVLSLRNKGHGVTFDPDDQVDAVVCDSTTYRLAPSQIPLFILLTGGLSDWAVKKEQPDAHFYTDPALLVEEIQANVCQAKETDLPAHVKDSIIISSYANKGGVGKTTTAVSIATMLARQGVSTVVCDFDYGGANLAAFYNINKRFKNYLDGSVESSLFEVQRNLYLLPTPSDIVPAQVQAEDVTQTLALLQDRFQVVVCDTPPAPWEKAYLYDIFAKSDFVYAIVNQSKFSVEETKIYAPQLLFMGALSENIRIILNSYNPKLMSPRKVEQAFSEGFKKDVSITPKICALIPHEYEENVVALQKGEIINKDIWNEVVKEIVDKLNCSAKEVPVQQKKSGLFSLFRRG